MSVELRWAVPPWTTTEKAVLQYRVLTSAGEGLWFYSEWKDVPTVVVREEERDGYGEAGVPSWCNVR